MINNKDFHTASLISNITGHVDETGYASTVPDEQQAPPQQKMITAVDQSIVNKEGPFLNIRRGLKKYRWKIERMFDRPLKRRLAHLLNNSPLKIQIKIRQRFCEKSTSSPRFASSRTRSTPWSIKFEAKRQS